MKYLLFIFLLVIVLLSAGCSESSMVTTPTSSVTLPSIVMATDKMHYIRSEMIKLKVTNGLDVPIWYIGYPQRDLVYWDIERAQNNSWQRQNFLLPMIEGNREVCRIILYERPIGAVIDLKPHSDLLYEWNQKLCTDKTVTEPFEPEMIEPGRYRFALCYSLVTVKSENIETEPWKRPIDLGGIKIIYSNEFVLE